MSLFIVLFSSTSLRVVGSIAFTGGARGLTNHTAGKLTVGPTDSEGFTMDCDRVFTVLTAGPFPTGTDLDDHVELHLSDCKACRSLSEALRPAPELFHESLTPSENQDLPIYHAMSMTSSGWLKTDGKIDHPTQQMQATLNRPVRPSRPTHLADYNTRDRWSNMVSSVEIGQRSDITTVLTFVSLLAITMFSLGWIVQ